MKDPLFIRCEFQGSEDCLATPDKCLSRGGANYEDLLSCWRESIFIILVSGESYATSGASDSYLKQRKGPGGDVVCSLWNNLQQNNSSVWVQNYKVDLPEKKRAKAIVLGQNRQ